ncbi:MAG: hypothetical protein JNK21_05300 [Rhodospirillaceae bacterium]|nr:hypothetical protein [Rhodospirillaceae bacterium]
MSGCIATEAAAIEATAVALADDAAHPAAIAPPISASPSDAMMRRFFMWPPNPHL